jgi:hypothetical protein
MRSKTPVSTLAALLIASMALGACDPDEQGRKWSYEKGTYLGEPDTPLTTDQVEELRHRAKQQAGS